MMEGIYFSNLSPETSLYHRTEKGEVVLDYNIFAICFEGVAEGEINGEQLCFQPMDVAILLSGTKIRVKKVSKNYFGYLITIKEDYLSRLSLIKDSIQYKYIFKNPITTLSSESYEIILTYRELFNRINNSSQKDLLYQQVFQNLFASFELELSRSYYNYSEKNNSNLNLLFADFLNILKKNHLSNRSVSYYADYYAMSRRSFTREIKEASGKSPKEWINIELVKTAKDLLVNSNITINEVADLLNFAHQSAFGYFFKRETGFTPLDYRNARQKECNSGIIVC